MENRCAYVPRRINLCTFYLHLYNSNKISKPLDNISQTLITLENIHSSAESQKNPQINANNTVNLIFVFSQIQNSFEDFLFKLILLENYDIARNRYTA